MKRSLSKTKIRRSKFSRKKIRRSKFSRKKIRRSKFYTKKMKYKRSLKGRKRTGGGKIGDLSVELLDNVLIETLKSERGLKGFLSLLQIRHIPITFKLICKYLKLANLINEPMFYIKDSVNQWDKPDRKGLGYRYVNALYYAILNKSLDEIDFVLQNGADPNFDFDFDGFTITVPKAHLTLEKQTPLLLATQIYRPDIMEMLIQYGADVNKQLTMSVQGREITRSLFNFVWFLRGEYSEQLKVLLDHNVHVDANLLPFKLYKRVRGDKNLKSVLERYGYEASF